MARVLARALSIPFVFSLMSVLLWSARSRGRSPRIARSSARGVQAVRQTPLVEGQGGSAALPDWRLGPTRVLVVQPENRPLQTFADLSKADWLSAFASVNRAWACRHGYTFRVARAKDLAGEKEVSKMWVPHPTHGERHPAWFKVLAMLHGLVEGFDLVVMLDSDAVVVRQEASAEDMLRACAASPLDWTVFSAGKRGFEANGSMPTRPVDGASLVVSHEWNPTHHRKKAANANTGVVFVRNTPQAAEILRSWWDADPNGGWYRKHHDYEQGGFNKAIVPVERFRRHIAKVQNMIINGHDGAFVRHVTKATPLRLNDKEGWLQSLLPHFEGMLSESAGLSVGVCPSLEQSVREIDVEGFLKGLDAPRG